MYLNLLGGMQLASSMLCPASMHTFVLVFKSTASIDNWLLRKIICSRDLFPFLQTKLLFGGRIGGARIDIGGIVGFHESSTSLCISGGFSFCWAVLLCQSSC